MNWKDELVSLFDDPLLAEIRPLPPKATSDDRLVQSFLEINTWIAVNHREPNIHNDDFKEKILYRRLKNLRADPDKRKYLKEFDEFSLL